MPKYTLSYRRRIRLCRIVTLENLNEPIPIETTILYCRYNQLKELPKSIGNLIHLQILDCSHNQLQELPEWIGNLINLQYLNCCNNRLIQLPESIGNLINLGYLDYSNNQLQQLPKTPVSTCEWIGNLNNLQYLYCDNNPFTKEINDIISKYPILNNKVQEMLQELRDAYLIPTDNSQNAPPKVVALVCFKMIFFIICFCVKRK
jgi:Leucine-rich repeat (LRR) protein